jgi:hypothetical protein
MRLSIRLGIVLCFLAPILLAQPRDPCTNFKCPQGQRCIAPADAPMCVPIDQDACSGRCRPGTHCATIDGKPSCVADITCANVKCIAGTHCVMQDGVPACIPDCDPCGMLDCPAGSHCEMEDGRVRCVRACGPCDRVDCGAGQHCEEVDEGRARCVDTPSPCASTDCKRGFHCVVVGGKASCIRDANACDVCPPGTQCFIASPGGQVSCVINQK